MASFFIVRHGESTWNALHRWQGQADPPLSDLGERQARAAAAVIGRLGRVDGIVTSSLQRARETGALIAAGTGIALHDPVAALSERSAGAWEGLTRPEIDERFPGYLHSGDRPSGYESEESVVGRALAAIESLAAASAGRRWMVVSHGGVIHALERHAQVETGEWQRLDNLEGRWFHHTSQSLRADAQRLHLLDHEHSVADADHYV